MIPDNLVELISQLNIDNVETLANLQIPDDEELASVVHSEHYLMWAVFGSDFGPLVAMEVQDVHGQTVCELATFYDCEVKGWKSQVNWITNVEHPLMELCVSLCIDDINKFRIH